MAKVGSQHKLTVKLVKEKEVWEDFTKSQSPSIFLQSWGWGEFQKTYGRKIWRLGVYEEDNEEKSLIGSTFCCLMPSKFKTHIYTSNGPVLDWEHAEIVLPPLLDRIKEVAKDSGAIFARIDPVLVDTPENRHLFKQLGLQQSPKSVQAECRWIIDVTQDEDAILANMRKNTRYMVRRSAKEGVKVRYSSNPKDFPKFWGLFKQTVERQKFRIHPQDYYKGQIEAFASGSEVDPEADSDADVYRIYWAELDGEILATALIPFYGDSAYYLHAASTDKYKNAFPAYALIWQVIQDAKAEGLSYFDMWGVAPTDNPKDPMAGFTFFKMGFGGFRQKLMPAHDLPVSKKYAGVKLAETAKKLTNR